MLILPREIQQGSWRFRAHDQFFCSFIRSSFTVVSSIDNCETRFSPGTEKKFSEALKNQKDLTRPRVGEKKGHPEGKQEQRLVEVGGTTRSKARSGASMVGAQVKRERDSRLEGTQDTKGHTAEFWAFS